MTSSSVPFTINIADELLERIRSGLSLPDGAYAPDDDHDWKYGTDLAYLREFVTYWREEYDWRAAEKRLNSWPQFMAHVNGFDIHFYHIRGSGDHPFPIVLTHGWPGSVVEFLDVIDLLAFPERSGGCAADGFDLVIPSMPGYGFSSRPSSPIGPRLIAGIWRSLMTDILGYSKFGAQGGDWGSAVTTWLGREHGDVVSAIHLNFMSVVPSEADEDEEITAWRAKTADVRARESAYVLEHRTKPQTIGLALSASPVAFASWVLEKFRTWGDTHGELESTFSKDVLITNMMTYLVNDAVASAIWLYNGVTTDPRPRSRIEVPTGCAIFPADFLPAPPRQAVERLFNVHRWTEMAAGGHFAALEQPVSFAHDVRAFFRDFRRLPDGATGAQP